MTDSSSNPALTAALEQLATDIHSWSRELGFQQAGIADLEIGAHATHYQQWLAQGMHADMRYMADQRPQRLSPESLHNGTLRVISLRMDYLPAEVETVRLLDHPSKAYVARYALGRDYHKLIRKRVALLAEKMEQRVNDSPALSGLNCSQRPFVDSAPVLERAFAENAGLGWIGKNTMLINSKAGSWFFLAELFTSLPLPVSEPHTDKHCGSCTACLDICPTNAFPQPFVLDANKCISYLTIENRGTIPVEYRKAMGNRVFGCDDCQLICPWNKFASHSRETDFNPRHNLHDADLLSLFLWDEETFEDRTAGSAIRRTGYEGWLRNLAVALGNARTQPEIIEALLQRRDFSPLVREHTDWALAQHTQ